MEEPGDGQQSGFSQRTVCCSLPLFRIRLLGRRRSRLGRLGAVGDSLVLSLCQAQGPVALKAFTLCAVGGSWLLAQGGTCDGRLGRAYLGSLLLLQSSSSRGGGGSLSPWWVSRLCCIGAEEDPVLYVPLRLSLFLSLIENRGVVSGAMLPSDTLMFLPQRLRFCRQESHARWFAWKPNGGSWGPGSRLQGTREPEQRGAGRDGGVQWEKMLCPSLSSQGGDSEGLRNGPCCDRKVSVAG